MPEGARWRYGLILPFQAGPSTGGAFVNVRIRNGVMGHRIGHGDYEVGNDVALFDSVDGVLPGATLTLHRNHDEPNPHSDPPGQTSIMVKYPMRGGFVPLGAITASGADHPGAGTGFGISLALVVLVIASFITAGVLRLLSVLLLDQPSLWLSIGIRFLPFGLDVVIFALLFRFVPARYVHWDAVLPAALLGAVGWELAKSGFSFYLTNLGGFQFVYGGIATVIVFLFWAYLIAAIFLFSAEFCARLNDWIVSRATSEAEARASVSISIRDGQIRVQLPDQVSNP
jgi:hypothetical protein